MNAPLSSDLRSLYKAGAKIRRKMVPAKQAQALDEPDDRYATRSEAYQLAVANRHKSWARRYLRSIGRFP